MLPDKELPFNSVEPIYILNWWTPNAWPHPTTPASELVTFHKASLLEAPKALDLSLWVHHTCPLAEDTEWIPAIAHSSCPKCQLWWNILKLHKYEKLLNCNKLVPKWKHCPSTLWMPSQRKLTPELHCASFWFWPFSKVAVQVQRPS